MDNERIEIVKGTNSCYQDTEDLYFDLFEEARRRYNEKQTREGRKINTIYHFFVDKMWWNKEKRDKYYSVAYELYGKNVFNNDQMQTIHDTKIRSAEMDRDRFSDDYEL